MRNNGRAVRLGLAALTALALLGAAPLNTVSYQGVLRDAANNPLDGDFDMVFRFFDSSDVVTGQEILVDSHVAADGLQVAVTDGLFAVVLGGGITSDGSGPGTYLFLSEVFRDFPEVWLELEVDGDVLAPRTLIQSVPAALNSRYLVGLDPDQFLRADAADAFFGGTLYVNPGSVLDVEGKLGVGTATPGTKAEIVDGSLTLTGGNGTWGGIWFKTQHLGTSSNHHMIVRGEEDPAFAESLTISHRNGTPVDDPGTTGRAFRVLWDGTTLVGSSAADLGNPAGGGRLYVASGASIGGPLRTGAMLATTTYNHLGGTGVPDAAGWMATPDDLYVASDLEVDGFAGFHGSVFVNVDAPDQDQHLYFYDNGSGSGEELGWNELSDRFQFSNDLYVNGNISKSGTVSFVQNHPLRPDLSIRYVALEGAEAGTYTRGSARLVDGEARIALEEPFAWVTNPDVGLTAQVTPRGRGAALYVASLTTHELVVRAMQGSPDDVEFDYLVQGIRIGWESYDVVQPKIAEAPLPTERYFDATIAAEPALAAYRPMRRFLAMRERAGGSEELDLSATATLKRAIGERDPDAEEPGGLQVGTAGAGGGTAAPARTTPETVGASTPPAAGAAPNDAPEAARPVRDVAGDLFARTVRPAAGELAGYYPVSELVEVGDVLVMDPDHPGKMRRGSVEGDPAVFGIVSGEPGLVLGSGVERIAAADPELAEKLRRARADGDREAEGELWGRLERRFEEAHAPVALSGVVSCKVDASYGAIRPGDLLTVSPTPGHAMRSRGDVPGTIVGKAMESLDSGTGRIRVLVMLR